MEYVSAKYIAEQWGITERRVQAFCSNGQIPGVKRLGRQWLIPVNAERPRDGRYNRKKDYSEVESYHYPILMFTRFFTNTDGLSEDEILLLKAQIMYLRGDHQKSIKSCRDLLKDSPAHHVAFGCYATICYASIPLGLSHEFITSYKMMEIYAEKATFQREDYNLVLAELNFHIGWDTESILKIHPENLIPDAKPHFYATLLFTSMPKEGNESIAALLTYKGICLEMVGQGLAPMAVQMCSLLAIFFNKLGNTEEDTYLIHIAVSLARRHNLWSFLTMFYTLNMHTVDIELADDYNTLNYMKKTTELSINNWRSLNIARHGKVSFQGIPIAYAELMLFLANDLTPVQIAEIENTTSAQIEKKIMKICKSLKLSSERELIALAKAEFSKLGGGGYADDTAEGAARDTVRDEAEGVASDVAEGAARTQQATQ